MTTLLVLGVSSRHVFSIQKMELHRHLLQCLLSSILICIILVASLVLDETLVLALVNDEGWALLAFKGGVNDPLGVLKSWNASDQSPCNWYGITCDLQSKVKQINLQNTKLAGPISPEFHHLQNLRSIVLSRNNLSGPVPWTELSEIGTLLWKLDLSHNALSGGLPLSFSNLTGLGILDLSANNLSGTIPDFLFYGFRHARVISLAANMFTGYLPTSLGSCMKLTSLNVSSNNFQGFIPSILGRLMLLENMSLQRNNFSGLIPGSFGSLLSLRVLNMGYNQLSGSLPLQLSQLSYLEELFLSNNILSGEVPADIVYLPSLQTLDLSFNVLTGQLPFYGGNCMLLQNVNLAGNNFQGAIPTALNTCSYLISVNLSSNQLSSFLPPEIGQLRDLMSLDVSGNNLGGRIPVEIGGLSGLILLRLANNLIDGVIPPQIGHLGALEVLDLSDLKLQGSIPSALRSCTSLITLNLSNNNLSGRIPSILGELKCLRELALQYNAFIGSIPSSLGNLKQLTYFNVSYNYLSGTIPQITGLRQFNADSYIGNPGLCGIPLEILCVHVPTAVFHPNTSTTLPVINKDHKQVFLSATAIFAITAAGALAIAVIVIALLHLRGWNQQHQRKQELLLVEGDIGSSNTSPVMGKLVLFDDVLPARYQDWEAVTKALFDKECVVGRGSIGTVHKARLHGGLTIAVKVLNQKSFDQIKDLEELETEMNSLGHIRHHNLVAFQGYYWSSKLKLMLCDYIPNGTLFYHLHGQPTTLTWLRRHCIALGIARGLAYLHHAFRVPIMHFKLTSTNVLLDRNFEPKISDYGLGKFLSRHSSYTSSRRFHTALGYAAPEVVCQGLRPSEKCDVYSFGVVLLELVTGREPVEGNSGNSTVLGEFVRSRLEHGRLSSCIDPKLSFYPESEIGQVLKLAIICTSKVPATRPSMADAVQVLESMKPAGSVPLDIPKPMAPTMSTTIVHLNHSNVWPRHIHH